MEEVFVMEGKHGVTSEYEHCGIIKRIYNGLTNGLIEGRINWLINWIINGRINSLVNRLVNVGINRLYYHEPSYQRYHEPSC